MCGLDLHHREDDALKGPTGTPEDARPSAFSSLRCLARAESAIFHKTKTQKKALK